MRLTSTQLTANSQLKGSHDCLYREDVSGCLFIGPSIPILVLNSLCLGEVYTWGDNDEGQLGDGTTNAIQRPRLVPALQGKKVNRVACGSAHTLAWSTSKPASAGKLPTQVGTGWAKWVRRRASSDKVIMYWIMCAQPHNTSFFH